MSPMAEDSLAGRRILITGGASGIGAAVARLFAAEGATLFLADRSSAVASAAAEIGAHWGVMDVTEEASVISGVAAACEAMGGLDGLVSCAGVATLSRLADTSLDEWRRQVDVNLTGPFLVCREAAAPLRASGAATIVILASASGLRPSLAGGAYAASKAGVIMLSKSLAMELGPQVRVNAVCPGMVDTPMFAAMVPERTAAFEAQLKADYALGRLAEPDEIARAVLFLTQPASGFITGSALAVDGGRTFH